ncbi:MAG: hypothetical protein JNM14_06680 [Ferruginibacter sp.]|nr:hypothetical protein [Ferruginibacter sp.]
MKKFLLLLILTVTCCISYSQDIILDKKSKIKKRLEKYYLETNRKYFFAETDSTLTYTLTDSVTLPATYVYYFNRQNRCIKQETIYTRDLCLQNGIQESLNNKYAKWEKLGPESYYAKFPYNTLMETVKENGQFILRYVHKKRKEL